MDKELDDGDMMIQRKFMHNDNCKNFGRKLNGEEKTGFLDDMKRKSKNKRIEKNKIKEIKYNIIKDGGKGRK